MLQEALQQAGADAYERTDARKAHRNGYKDRTLKTPYGETILRKPQFRELPFERQVFGRYARVEKALVNAIAEFYLQASRRERFRRSLPTWGSTTSPRRRFPGWPRTSTIRYRHSFCGRSSRQPRTSSWMAPITKFGTEHDTSPRLSW
ncbi:MAG TPA: hypothetical protein GXX59_03430 [Syntrophomonadaceae bacterium]|nr:hypothetical protein [Syntrophomonadaceae bacterium]